MTLFDSIQNMIFGKKKSARDIVENNALGQVISASQGASSPNKVSSANNNSVPEKKESDRATIEHSIALQKKEVKNSVPIFL